MQREEYRYYWRQRCWSEASTNQFLTLPSAASSNCTQLGCLLILHWPHLSNSTTAHDVTSGQLDSVPWWRNRYCRHICLTRDPCVLYSCIVYLQSNGSQLNCELSWSTDAPDGWPQSNIRHHITSWQLYSVYACRLKARTHADIYCLDGPSVSTAKKCVQEPRDGAVMSKSRRRRLVDSCTSSLSVVSASPTPLLCHCTTCVNFLLHVLLLTDSALTLTYVCLQLLSGSDIRLPYMHCMHTYRVRQ